MRLCISLTGFFPFYSYSDWGSVCSQFGDKILLIPLTENTTNYISFRIKDLLIPISMSIIPKNIMSCVICWGDKNYMPSNQTQKLFKPKYNYVYFYSFAHSHISFIRAFILENISFDIRLNKFWKWAFHHFHGLTFYVYLFISLL